MLYDIEVVTGALRRIRIQLLATPHAGRPLIAGNVQAITQNRKGNGSVHGKKKTKETGSSRKSIGEIKTIRKVRLHRTFWKIVRVCISQK